MEACCFRFKSSFLTDSPSQHFHMILSSKAICERLENGDLVITPYAKTSQQPASYDLRSASETVIKRNESVLVHSIERVELPADIAATLRCRSSYARRGLLLGGGFVDPGFRGQLTLALFNGGREDVIIGEGERIVQMIMQEVSDGHELYGGRYQDSEGVVNAR